MSPQFATVHWSAFSTPPSSLLGLTTLGIDSTTVGSGRDRGAYTWEHHGAPVPPLNSSSSSSSGGGGSCRCHTTPLSYTYSPHTHTSYANPSTGCALHPPLLRQPHSPYPPLPQPHIIPTSNHSYLPLSSKITSFTLPTTPSHQPQPTHPPLLPILHLYPCTPP